MINRIIDFSVNNKVIVFIIVAAACLLGWWSMQHLTLDAVPDLTDTQVIIYSRWDRSPDIMEDQVTYPIVTAMVGPHDRRHLHLVPHGVDGLPGHLRDLEMEFRGEKGGLIPICAQKGNFPS